MIWLKSIYSIFTIYLWVLRGSFIINLALMEKQILTSKEGRFKSQDFEKVISTALNLGKFYPLVQKRLAVYGSMSSLSRTFESFLMGDVNSPDQRWLFFKLMISFDLFGIIDVLFLSSQGLQDYIDRLYLPYHYTSLRSDAENYDDPEKIVDEIIEESFRQSRISYLLEVVIGLHLDIKEQSLMSLHFNQGKIIKKYQIIQKHMQDIHTIILKKHLREEDFNDEIQNDENRFLISYYHTTDVFKNSLEDLRLILEYEELLYEFQEANNTQKNHKNINEDKIKESRIMKMLKTIETIYNKFKWSEDPQIISKQSPSKESPAGKKKIWTSKTKVAEVEKLDQEYEQLIKIFNKQYKSDPFEILQLLKLNIIKYIFEKVKIRKCDLELFKYFVNLKLFNSKISQSLWLSLKEPMINIVNFLNSNQLDIGVEEDCPLFHYDKLFKQEQQLAQNFIKIQNIFKEVDLLIASEICGSWVETTEISNENKVLVIGKTKAGKSSLLNFLSRNPGMMTVGETLTSKTFYPEYVNIQIQGQVWEWWDLPGLLDTRSFIFRLCIGFFLKCIVNSSLNAQLKFILVSKNIDIFEVDSFSKMIKLFGNLFNWKESGLQSLSVIFTHIQNREGIDDAYDQERERVIKTDHEVFLQKIRPIKNLSDLDAAQFYSSFRDQIFNTQQYFTREDNKSPTKDSESRERILNLVNGCLHVKDITVEPIIFLFDDESAFLQRFNIEYRAKEFLDPKRQESNELFLKLFSIIQSFRTINTESIKNEYKIIKDKLRRQYQLGIHDSFVKLNQLNFQENKNKDSTTNIINKILKYHLRSYFASFQEKVRSFLLPYSISPELIKIVFKKTEEYAKNREINLQSEIKTILQQIDADQVKDIISTLLMEAERQNKMGIRSEEEEVDLLLSYLKYLVNYKQKEIISIMKEPHGTLERLEQSLFRTTLKEEYKAIFNEKDSNMKKKLNKFFKLKKGNYIETTLLQAVEELFSESKTSLFEPEMMVEHFLQLLSKQNYESNLRLDFRYNKLFPNDKIENILKSLRLDFYGECIHNKEVFLSEFLKINTIEEKKKSPEDETVYVFSQHSFIKVYCTKFIFDLEKVNIKCKESFCIVADEIEFSHDKQSVKAIKFNKEPATLIIILQKQSDEPFGQYKEKMESIQARLVLYTKPYKEIDTDLEKIKYIQSHGVLVSRTCIEAATYLELFYYDPSFSYLLSKDPGSKHRRHILKIKVAKNITGSRCLEFGQLHLKRLVQSRIEKGRKGLENKYLTESETLCLRNICNKTVQYIKDKFQHTTIRLKYEHFNTIFCKKMAQHIFQLLKNNPRQDIKNIMRSCHRMMKQQMFGHIYIGIINILESQYTKQYGRHYSSRKIQTESFQIKKYCESLIEMPLHRFQKQNQEENLNALTKKFKLRFQKNMFYFIQEKISLKNIFLGIYTYIVGINETEEDKRDKLSYDTAYIDTETEKLRKNQGFFVGEEKEKEKRVLQEARMEDSFLGTDNDQIDYENFKQSRQDSKLLCQKYRFSELIKTYETQNTIFTGKQDEIHSYLGYAYMKKRRFKEADGEFKLLPSENQSSDKNKIIFDILKRKYNSIEDALLAKETSTNQRKRNEIIEKETFDILKNPFKFEGKESKESRSSLTRYIERDRDYFNILSLDSAKWNNHIVNIVLAAEIEKCTHRPIMHMFDMIVCKNSSALIGAALAIPTRTERDPTYGVKLYPQFCAFQFIKASQIMLKSLDEQMSIKAKFKPSDYDFRNLHTILAIVSEDQKESTITTTFNNAQTVSKRCRTIYDIVLKTVGNAKQEKEVDPLFDTFNDKHVPAIKSDKKIDILSLGTGTYYHMLEREFNHSRDNKRINSFNRWQVLLEDEEKMEDLKVEDYIQLTRIMIEEKWINETKEMRDMMDKLEDRPSIKYLNKKRNQ